MKQQIEDFFKFLESKGEKKVPIRVKFIYSDKFGPLTKEELNVEGDLNLKRSKIESLPDNLKVGGTLNLSYTKIESLPDNLKVEGNLYLWETPIGEIFNAKEIRQEIERKGGYVKGGISIENT